MCFLIGTDHNNDVRILLYYDQCSVNVLGYFKTCIVFVGGVMFFDTNADFKNVMGITLTMVGVLLYTYVQLKGEEAKQPKANQAPDLQLKVQEKV